MKNKFCHHCKLKDTCAKDFKCDKQLILLNGVKTVVTPFKYNQVRKWEKERNYHAYEMGINN